MHDNNISLSKLYEIIELCKYASIDGEKLEIILNSNNNGNRELFINLSGGLSQDENVFRFKDGENFDNNILPLIIKKFLNLDEVSSWDFRNAVIPNGTNKSLIETTSGNEFLIQTYSNSLIDELKAKVKNSDINQAIEDQRTILTDDEKKCEAALKYVNKWLKDIEFLEGLSNSEKEYIFGLIAEAYSTKGNYTEEEILSYMKDKRSEHPEIIDKVLTNIADKNILLSNQISKILKNERSFSKYDGDHSFSVRKKVAMYLSQNGYFNARLNFPKGTDLEKSDSLEEEINKNSKSKYNILLNAKVYFKENNMSEEVKAIDDFMNFLIKKQRKMLGSKEKNRDVKINQDITLNTSNINRENIITDFSILKDTFNLCNNAKIGNEKVLIKVSNDEFDFSKRKIEISLMGGMSRDRYEYIFEDGNTFDKEVLPKMISMIGEKERVDKIESNEVSLLNRDNVLLSYESGNQFLIGINGIKRNSIESYLTNGELKNEKVSDLLGVVNNVKNTKTLDENVGLDANKIQEKALTQESIDLDNLLEMVENEILTYGLEKKVDVDFSDKFERLHYLATKYQPLISKDGNLIIYERDTKQVYLPKNDCEREEIEFASFWANCAGISYTSGDLFPGENVAFNDEAKKLFNIMNVHFEESLKRGINIDVDSLNRQFANSGYSKANIIFERLFKDEENIDEIISYYKEQLQQNNNNLTNIEMTSDDKVDDSINFMKSDYDQLTELDEIKVAYDVASTYSNSDKPVSLKIFFPNEEKNKAQIIISYGPTNDEDVLYQKTFDTNIVMDKFLPEICNDFVNKNGIVTNDTFKVPNTNKGGSITLGMNDALLQMSNADMSDVEKLQTYLSKSMANKNKVEIKKVI